MSMRTYVNGKIHGIRVTDKSVKYHGSVTIGANYLRAAEIDEHEQVDVINLSNGARWTTYAIAGPDNVFTLNGGGARLGEIGDECVIITYASAKEFNRAPVVFVGDDNEIKGTGEYLPKGDR